VKDLDTTPIACSLTTAELRDREATLLAQFRSAIVETEELPEGYAFRIPGDSRSIVLLAELIVAERACCPFLTVQVMALPHMGPVVVLLTGGDSAKEFLRTVLLKPGE